MRTDEDYQDSRGLVGCVWVALLYALGGALFICWRFGPAWLRAWGG